MIQFTLLSANNFVKIHVSRIIYTDIFTVSIISKTYKIFSISHEQLSNKWIYYIEHLIYLFFDLFTEKIKMKKEAKPQVTQNNG